MSANVRLECPKNSFLLTNSLFTFSHNMTVYLQFNNFKYHSKKVVLMLTKFDSLIQSKWTWTPCTLTAEPTLITDE